MIETLHSFNPAEWFCTIDCQEAIDGNETFFRTLDNVWLNYNRTLQESLNLKLVILISLALMTDSCMSPCRVSSIFLCVLLFRVTLARVLKAVPPSACLPAGVSWTVSIAAFGLIICAVSYVENASVQCRMSWMFQCFFNCHECNNASLFLILRLIPFIQLMLLWRCIWIPLWLTSCIYYQASIQIHWMTMGQISIRELLGLMLVLLEIGAYIMNVRSYLNATLTCWQY